MGARKDAEPQLQRWCAVKRSAPLRRTELRRKTRLKDSPIRVGQSLERTGELKRKTRLTSGRGPRATGGKRFPRRRQPEFTAWIRTLPCVVAGRGCWGLVVAAHVVKTRGAGAWDRGFVAPLCEGHHEEQEGKTARFNAKYAVDLEQIATELAA